MSDGLFRCRAPDESFLRDFFGMGQKSEISLRDHFAGQALQGWMASDRHTKIDWKASEISHECYHLADAMLTERAKK